MSEFELEPSVHDIHVSLAIRHVTSFAGGSVLFADGSLPIRDHVADCSPVIHGYRADAIVKTETHVWFIEVKSWGDLHSAHSRDQYQILAKILCGDRFCRLYLMVFGSDGRNVILPVALEAFRGSDQLIFVEC